MKNGIMDFPALLALLAHDMKNSLGLILTDSDEIFSTCSSNTCPSFQYVSHIQYEAKRLNNHLVQLLTLFKMDAEHYSPNISHNSVYDFLEECVFANSSLMEMRGINIALDCDENLVWFFDRELMSGVVNNVLNNAYRYAGDKVQISAFEKDGYLVIYLNDNGNGYPQHLIEQLAEPNWVSNFSTGSTGLGIYFARIVTKLHRNKGKEGFIVMDNLGPNGGGEFQIYLP